MTDDGIQWISVAEPKYGGEDVVLEDALTS